MFLWLEKLEDRKLDLQLNPLNIFYTISWVVIIILISKRTSEPNNIFNSYPIILPILSILAFSSYIRNPFTETLVYFTGFSIFSSSAIVGFLLARRGSKSE